MSCKVISEMKCATLQLDWIVLAFYSSEPEAFRFWRMSHLYRQFSREIGAKMLLWEWHEWNGQSREANRSWGKPHAMTQKRVRPTIHNRVIKSHEPRSFALPHDYRSTRIKHENRHQNRSIYVSRQNRVHLPLEGFSLAYAFQFQKIPNQFLSIAISERTIRKLVHFKVFLFFGPYRQRNAKATCGSCFLFSSFNTTVPLYCISIMAHLITISRYDEKRGD